MSYIKYILYIFICIFLFLTLSIFFLNQFINNYLNEDLNIENNKTVINIPIGSSINEIGKILQNQNIINNKFLFKIGLYTLKNKFSPKAGEYSINKNTSLLNIIDKIHNGDVISYKITFTEGMKVKEILKKIKNDNRLIGKIPATSPEEGSLFPETYFFNKGYSKQKLILRMKKLMDQKLNELWNNRDLNLPLSNKKEALILASMVESETGANAERKIISSVFFNRINRKMRLQSDPTVLYGLEKKFKLDIKRLKYSHLRLDHDWNTYTRRGLPKTAICNPSEESLNAVFLPFKTDYFYFVADTKGGHFFAKTFVEHKKNILYIRKNNKYYLNNFENYEIDMPLPKPNDF